jgi:hypothetical protein
MKVEVVLTEADIAQEFAEAIEARDLPRSFSSGSHRSAAEWAALGEHASFTVVCGRPGRDRGHGSGVDQSISAGACR